MTAASDAHVTSAPAPQVPADLLDAAIETVIGVQRALQDGVAPVAEVYAEGAVGALHHARDALRRATADGEGSAWRLRFAVAGIVQAGDAGARLSSTLEDGGFRASPRPDVGADLIRSERMRALVELDGFAALLASALAEHRWLHLASGSTWCGTWPAAEALVRALACGRFVARLGHREMRGTIDAEVARELAELGWRRVSSPALPGLS